MDIYYIFKPLIFISRPFCLAPFSLVDDSGSLKYQISTFWFLYSFVGVCFSIISQICLIFMDISFHGAVVMNATAKGLTVVTCLASIVSQVTCLSNGRNVIRILDQLSILDRDYNYAYTNYYKVFKILILLIMYTILFLVVPDVLCLFVANTNSTYSSFAIRYTGAISFLCDSSLWLTDIQFIYFVILLKYHFSVLNDTVNNFTVSSPNGTTANKPLKPSASDTNSSSSVICSLFQTSALITIKSALRKVCRHHSFLCDITQSVNRIYSFHILHSLAVTFFQIVCMMYYCSTAVSYPDMFQYFSSAIIVIVVGVMWFFTFISKVVLLVAVCSFTSYEVSG